ncbi:YheC/YheD family endospore coat-associated protein [Aneurinibacillus tyrosinisolvens]|uniref:YheC/YheD family endospore coat-associated protein n=1 Tax=Aneurinibacillus tyrosinisolvens TaxID=1443435 RepID=UPI00063FA28E|nr:YheC/YheD family protein [Aneurinibacillus tyrosinisolvens]
MADLRWIKVVSFISNQSVIRIDHRVRAVSSEKYLFHFGLKQTPCRVEWFEDPGYTDVNDANHPLELFVSTKMIQGLLIPEGTVFQLRFEKEEMYLGPTIGLLFGSNVENYTPEYMKEHYSDRMGTYSSFGGMVVAFSIVSVDWENSTVAGLIYHPGSGSWCEGVTAIPAVIYRRHIMQPSFKKFRTKLLEKNGLLINSDRLSKWRTYKVLLKNPIFHKYLPETHLLLTSCQLLKVLEEHNKIILKPKGSSQGKGIIIIKMITAGENRNSYLVTGYQKTDETPKQRLMNQQEFHSFIRKFAEEYEKKYICQKYISLAKVEGSPFDIRVIMQKNPSYDWICNGIECRIAGKGKEITNFSAGGMVLSFEKTIQRLNGQFDYETVKENVLRVCSEFCFWMEQQKQYHFVEFGIDLALDQSGQIYFIEANYRPGYKGFKTIGFEQYLRIGYEPLCYAASVQKFNIST